MTSSSVTPIVGLSPPATALAGAACEGASWSPNRPWKRRSGAGAHQLRSPLAGMALHVDQALAHGDPETVREALQNIRRLNQRTARVSTQLLALSRAQTVPETVEALEKLEQRARPGRWERLTKGAGEGEGEGEGARGGFSFGFAGDESDADIP